MQRIRVVGYERHILIVADEPANRESYARILTADSDYRYSIVEAGSGDEALQLVLTERPDCILLDFDLPDGNGLAFLAELAREYKNAFMSIVVLTDRVDENTAVAANKLGAPDHLVKSGIDTRTLSLAVTSAIQRMALKRRLAQKEAELEAFATTAARGLEGPLRRVMGYTEVLRQETDGQLSERGRECLEMIARHGTEMAQLVEDLMSYTTPLHTRGRPPEVIDLASLVRQILTSFEKQITAARAEIEVDEMVEITADRSAIQQLLTNLISNALKFHGKERPHIAIQSYRDRDHVLLTVADDGIGIEPEDQERVFTPLTRLHPARYQGNGIGLARCKRIVEQYGGRIWVQSAAGKGATFFIELPQATLQTTFLEADEGAESASSAVAASRKPVWNRQ